MSYTPLPFPNQAGTEHHARPSFTQAMSARPARLALWAAAAVASLIVIAGGLKHGPTASRKLGDFYASNNLGVIVGTKGWTKKPSDWRDLPQNEGLIEPEWEVDSKTGLSYPPDVYPASLNPYKRANAALVALVRNNEKDPMKESMRSVEERFNRKFGYPWVMLNDEPFTQEFKDAILSMTRSEVIFDVIPKEHWGYPDWVNQTLAAEERQKMVDENVIYGGSESYRHMCRYNSGFFYRQRALEPYDYYWRVEPGVEFFCDVDQDPFLFMQQNKKVYSFTISLYEYERTIQSLWQTVRDFAKLHPEHIADKNALGFLVDEPEKGLEARYNLCHFWSNFEIADLRFFRGKAYSDFFDYLDATGNFFYERWGDAPVHSIAAALFVPATAIHQFDDIAYRHNPYLHCPQNPKYFDSGKCNCKREESFDNDGYSCMRQWWRVAPNPNDIF